MAATTTEPRNRGKMSGADRATMWKLKDSGKSDAQIAKSLNFTESYIANALAKGRDYTPSSTRKPSGGSGGSSNGLYYSKGALSKLDPDALVKLIENAREVLKAKKDELSEREKAEMAALKARFESERKAVDAALKGI